MGGNGIEGRILRRSILLSQHRTDLCEKDTTCFSSVEVQFVATDAASSKTPPALAAWSFSFSPPMQPSREIPPASAAWSFSFSLPMQHPREIPPASAAWYL